MSVPIRSLYAVLLLMIVPAAVGPADAEPERPIVGVYSLDGLPQSGHLVGLDAEGLRLQGRGEDEAKNFALDSLREVRFPNGVRTPAGAHHRLTLTGGEVLVGHVRTPSEDGCQLEVAFVGRIEVLWDVVLTLEAVPAGAGPKHDDADKYPAEPKMDVAHLTSNDLYRGTLTNADETHLEIENERGRNRKVPWEKLRVMHLGDNDVPKPPTGVQIELELIDGSRLHTGEPPTLTDDGIAFKLRSAPEKTWTVPLSRIRVLRMKGGRFEYASDLKFTFDRTPPYGPSDADDPWFGGMRKRMYDPRRNRRQEGGPLQINGNVYRYGFAVYSKTEIVLELDGAFKSFRSGFGIDDVVEGKLGKDLASVDVRIYKDDSKTPVFERTDIKHGRLVAIGPIDTTDVKRLRLVVDWGKNDHVCDRADWVDPVVLRE